MSTSASAILSGQCVSRRKSILHRYHINVFYSDEDKAFIADVPELKYCSAHGNSPEKAVAEVAVAIENWLAAARDSGKVLSEPKYRPAMYSLGPLHAARKPVRSTQANAAAKRRTPKVPAG